MDSVAPDGLRRLAALIGSGTAGASAVAARFKLSNAETRRLQAGYGFGLLVYFLAPMNFEFAKRTDFKTESEWHMHFSFGKAF